MEELIRQIEAEKQKSVEQRKKAKEEFDNSHKILLFCLTVPL